MITLLYSGNLGLGHDLSTIINAIAEINNRVDLKVVFVGEGKAKPGLQKQVTRLGLDNIEFRPPVPLYRLSDIMAEGDVHLISQKEGTQGLIVPSKIYGILAAGRPSLFIGPEDCEPAIIIRESNSGFIIPPGDVDGAVKAIEVLASDRGRRLEMGRQAGIYYNEHFGRKRSVTRIIDAIESIA